MSGYEAGGYEGMRIRYKEMRVGMREHTFTDDEIPAGETEFVVVPVLQFLAAWPCDKLRVLITLLVIHHQGVVHGPSCVQGDRHYNYCYTPSITPATAG